MIVSRIALGLVGGLALAGCTTLGPDYERPKAELPAGYAAATERPAVAELPPLGGAELLDTTWWSGFGDPQLDALIDEALDKNRELRIAARRIEQFEASLQVARAAEMPQVSYDPGGSRDTLSQNRQVPLALGVDPVSNSYRLSGAISYEIDFWGRVKRSNEAARAELLASEEGRRALVATLVTDVASAYVQLLALDRELDLTRRTIASGEETVRLLETKLRLGALSELPVAKARAELEDLRARLPGQMAAVEKLENALSTLVGRAPGPIQRGRGFDALKLPTIPAGVPADVLVRRPDVRRAEAQLVAANARIGVAKAALLPNIVLTAVGGYASSELGTLARLESNFSSLGINLLGPIFTGGRLEGQVKEAEAGQRQAIEAYLRTVQDALREVEDALVDHRRGFEQVAARGRHVNALSAQQALARKREQLGLATLLEVLQADRDLLGGELLHNQARRDQFSALVAVYKAMGGGWTVADRFPSDIDRKRRDD